MPQPGVVPEAPSQGVSGGATPHWVGQIRNAPGDSILPQSGKQSMLASKQFRTGACQDLVAHGLAELRTPCYGGEVVQTVRY
jgi:hypothetical protein